MVGCARRWNCLMKKIFILLFALFLFGCSAPAAKSGSSKVEVPLVKASGEEKPQKPEESSVPPVDSLVKTTRKPPVKVLPVEKSHMECGFCHRRSGKGDLNSYIKEQSAKINPYTEKPLTRIEAICTSCHDFFHYVHPEGVSAKSDRVAFPEDARLEEGKMTCFSCHDIHQGELSYKSLYWPVKQEDRLEDFCLRCHLKKDQLKDDVYYMLTELGLMARRERNTFLDKTEDGWFFQGPVFIKRFYESMKGEKYDEAVQEEESFLIRKYSDIALDSLEKENVEEAIHLLWTMFRKKSDFAEAYTRMAKGLETIGKSGQVEKFYLRALERDGGYAPAYFQLGRILSGQGELLAAVDQFRNASRYDSQNIQTYFDMGDCFISLENYSEAIKSFRKIVNLEPRNLDGYLRLAHAYQLDNNHIDAIRVLKNGLSFFPNHFKIYFEIGNSYYAKFNTALAIAFYKKALQAKPGDSETYFRLGKTFEVALKMEEAIKNYEDALTADKYRIEGYLQLARLFQYLKRYKEAQTIYRSAIRIWPDSIEARLALGDVYYQEKDYPKAESEYQAVLSIDPHYRKVRFFLAKVYIRNDRVEEAITILQEMVKMKSGQAEVYLLLGECLSQGGNFQEAIGIYRKGLRYSPEQAVLYFNLGYIYWKKLSRTDSALEAFKKAIEVYPSYAKAYFYSGSILKEKEDITGAARFLEKAVELDPDRIDAHLLLVELARIQQKYSLADQAFLKGLNRSLSDFKEISKASNAHYELDIINEAEKEGFYYNLGTLYIANGKWENAGEAFSQVLKRNPTRSQALSNLVVSYRAQGRLDNALEKLSQLLSLHPEVPEIIFAVGNVYKDMGQKTQALQNYLKARDRALNNPETEGKINLAIAEIYDGFKRNKKDKELLTLGDSYYKEKNFSLAEKEYRAALSIDPENLQVYLRLGRLYHQTNRIDEAVTALQKAIDMKSDQEEIYLLMGECLINKGLFSKAVEVYRQGSDNCTEHAVLSFNLGYVYWKTLHRRDLSRESFEKAIAGDSSYGKAYFYLGCLLNEQGDIPVAVRFLEKSIQFDPNRIDAYLLLTELSRKQQRNSHADRFFSKGLNIPLSDFREISRNPHAKYELDVKKSAIWEEFYSRLGTVYMANGKWENATGAFSRILKWNPARTEILARIGIAYKAQNMFQEALEKFFKLLSLRPGDPDIFYEIGNIYKEMHQKKFALESYLKARNLAKSGSRKIYKLNLALADLYYDIWQEKKEKDLLIYAGNYHEKVLAVYPENKKLYLRLKKIEKLLSGQIQVFIVKSRWLRKYQEIAEEVRQNSTLDELMQIVKEYPKDSKITFLDPRDLDSKLQSGLNALKDGEFSPVIKNGNEYVGIYRITSSDGGKTPTDSISR